jgi:hypothetical protein
MRFHPNSEVNVLKLAATDFLVAAAKGELDLNRWAQLELAARGLDGNGRWVGFEKARQLATPGQPQP